VKPLAFSKPTLQLWTPIYCAAAAMTTLAWGADPAGELPSNPATATELPQVTVISNTPLEGLGLPLNQIPASVQTANSKDMENQQTLGIADYLNNNFSGVNVSESADNPFQLDINYHGFTASPLLGTPEGLSIYVDGVRVNESFGDTVNWDLIPQNAVSTVTLRADTMIPAPSSRPTAARSDGAPSRARLAGSLAISTTSSPELTSMRMAGVRTHRAGSIRHSARSVGRMTRRTST